MDLCPVGALTSKPYSFKARPWELTSVDSVDWSDSICSDIRVQTRFNEVTRILPLKNDKVNQEWITDKTRFCVDALDSKNPWVATHKESEKDKLDLFKIMDLQKGFQAHVITGPETTLEETVKLKALEDRFPNFRVSAFSAPEKPS